MPAKLSQQELIKRFKVKHSSTYDYSLVHYISIHTKIQIVCRQHGIFFQIPANHLKGSGCPKCGTYSMVRLRKITTTDFIHKAKQVHGDRYNYSKSVYTWDNVKVEIICSQHGSFMQLPYSHTTGIGCPKCGTNSQAALRRFTQKEFLQKVKEVHGNEYDYSKAVYLGKHKIEIICRKHGSFFQGASNHTYMGQGCPQCARSKGKGFSKIAIEWIEQHAYSNRLKNIQHALNGGEYCIPGTRLFVDGYHARSNTIFEFHGSCWHGDLNVYRPNSRPNPYSYKTAKQLYKCTIERENLIRSLGYNLIVIWESDYTVNNNKKLKSKREN